MEGKFITKEISKNGVTTFRCVNDYGKLVRTLQDQCGELSVTFEKDKIKEVRDLNIVNAFLFGDSEKTYDNVVRYYDAQSGELIENEHTEQNNFDALYYECDEM